MTFSSQSEQIQKQKDNIFHNWNLSLTNTTFMLSVNSVREEKVLAMPNIVAGCMRTCNITKRQANNRIPFMAQINTLKPSMSDKNFITKNGLAGCIFCSWAEGMNWAGRWLLATNWWWGAGGSGSGWAIPSRLSAAERPAPVRQPNGDISPIWADPLEPPLTHQRKHWRCVHLSRGADMRVDGGWKETKGQIMDRSQDFQLMYSTGDHRCLHTRWTPT